MYERILVPTDGSVGTAHVALQAIDLAEQYGATIHALYVVDESVRSLVSGLSDEEELEQRGRRAVDRIGRMATAHGVAVETAVEEGDPADGILAYAVDHDVDLIVAGTHGRTGIERRVIGSVAERIVRGAPCPVMTVRLPKTNVTVESAETASDIAAEAIDARGIDATITGADRQVSVWVVEAEGEDGSYLIYVDPVTQRTSIIKRHGESDGDR